jgi:hypothetical protein
MEREVGEFGSCSLAQSFCHGSKEVWQVSMEDREVRHFDKHLVMINLSRARVHLWF